MNVDTKTTDSVNFIKWLLVAFLVNALATPIALVTYKAIGFDSTISFYIMLATAPSLILFTVGRKNVGAAWLGALFCLPANFFYLLMLSCGLHGDCL